MRRAAAPDRVSGRSRGVTGMVETKQVAGVKDRRRAPARRAARRRPYAAALHPTPAERAATGRQARADVPRSAHTDWPPPAGRRDPVELLEEQATTRVAELLPVRYGRMLVSPFTFFRGGAAIMAADLACVPRTGLHTQLCGDAHLSNFGAFAAP